MKRAARSLRGVTLGASLSLVGLAPLSASAQFGFDEDDADTVRHKTLELDKPPVEAKCRQLEYYTKNAAALKSCSGVDASALTAPARDFGAAAGAYLWASNLEAVGACSVAPPAELTIPQDADVASAEQALEAAKQKLADARAAATPDAAAVAVAATEVTDKEAKLKAAKAKLNDLKQAQLPDLTKRARVAVEKLDAAFIVADGTKRTPQDFEIVAEQAISAASDDANTTTDSRSKACFEIYAARLKAFDTRVVTQAAQKAHEEDTLRKTSLGATVATLGSSSLEQPGSPDYVVYSLMTALGADEVTSGNQLSVSLNLSSLWWPEPKERLKHDAGLRNLFLRGTFPLNVTEGQTAAPTQDKEAEPDPVRRFSLLLGGSFVDETDTRLQANRRCYEAALAYGGFASTPKADESRLAERQAYFDACNYLVVNRQRVAWRAGVGFLSNQAKETASTKPEVAALALVWAPRSQLYLNLLGQYFFKPRKVVVGGVGVSVAGNAGGGIAGTNAWARLGLDTTFLVGHEPDTNQTSWELRLAPALRGRMFGDSVTSFAIGPRILSHGDPELLATVTFGYDADRIMTQLLTPTPTQP